MPSPYFIFKVILKVTQVASGQLLSCCVFFDETSTFVIEFANKKTKLLLNMCILCTENELEDTKH